jgi:hypothetical protein
MKHTYDYDWDTHKSQQSSTLLIMLPSDLDGSSGQTFNVLRGAYQELADERSKQQTAFPPVSLASSPSSLASSRFSKRFAN